MFCSRSDANGKEYCPSDDPFLEDGFGKLTKWRLSDLKKDFIKHLEDESNKPRTKEKKHSKEEKMTLHNDLIERYMKSALNKYNDEEKLDEVCGLFCVLVFHFFLKKIYANVTYNSGFRF